ncbi:tripartite tricarboxylate transporter substrate binding protein [Ancylobacter sp. MQZ15Z-1]|uniref:Tripartite tricarboxylate transporter substrate binding protein n=1 Tax=Ancylobacter mangrovi TaxID=2972472 RepID=A0A9X2PB34_9HYPH|nr:tripartite tricarboxylate transporter substrate binding protein [Ancylobacter mangrovi]MCS0494665.1 tripartite tricarboxylate transporter substrate binding protein [Ancylobacter mangrovi]
MRKTVIVGALAALSLGSVCSAALAQNCPSPLHIIAPAAPGGGLDQTGRALQQILVTEKLDDNVQVLNVPGAGGTIGIAQMVTQSRKDPGTLMVAANVLIGAILSNGSSITLADTRPVARLVSEYEVIVVPKDSPFKTLQDLLDALKADPGKVSWAGGSAGGTDQITAALIAKAVGVDPRKVNYIAFAGGGEALASVLGGKVSAGLNTYSEFREQIASGDLRLLAVAGPERLPKVDAPTLKEQGVDVVAQVWRMVTAPPGITDEQHAALVACVKAAATSEAWSKLLAERGWTSGLMTGPELDAFVKSETDITTDVLREIGFIK